MSTIMVVDDEAIVRLLLKTILENSNYVVLEAFDGPDALHIVYHHHIDLAIVDSDMPLMQGSELVRQIKVKRPNMPIIMITANPPANHGCDVLLVKPIKSADILSAVNSLLAP